MIPAKFKAFFLTVLLPLSASAQEPELFHPLWENIPVEVQRAPSGEGSPAAPPLPEGFTEELGGISARSVPEVVSDEITQLAAALGNDPVRIFNHVRNTIDYQQYFGVRKGAELTLLEGSGNDFDTSLLLIQLLRAAGHTDVRIVYQARYVPVFGNNGKNATEWLGLSEDPYPGKTYAEQFGEPNPYPIDDTSAKRLENAWNFVRARSIPFAGIRNNAGIAMTRIWTRLTYQGNIYHLDPAFKRYEKISGIDLAAASGYLTSGKDRAALLATAGGTAGSGYIQNLGRANIATFLNGRTADLLQTLSSQYPGATVEEIVSGRRIIKGDITDLSQAFPLPAGAEYGYGDQGVAVPEIAEVFATNVTFKTGDLPTDLKFTIATSELKGRKVALAASGNEVQLWIDDEKVAYKTVTTPTYAFTISLTHYMPNTVFSETKIYKKNDAYVYALCYGFSASRKLIEKRYDELEKHLVTDPDGLQREARSETLNVMVTIPLIVIS